MSVCGVGINDADYVVKVRVPAGYVNGKRKHLNVKICPFYKKWEAIIYRCYSEKEHLRNPSYTECTVCDEWLVFSNFKAWMETQDYEGKQLDKDLLVRGNKIYGPTTCIFVSLVVNSFMTESTASRGEWPIGVYWQKASKKFTAMCRNPFISKNEYLGGYDTPEEAHQAWLTRKLELAKLLASEQTDPRVATALIERYENYDTKERL